MQTSNGFVCLFSELVFEVARREVSLIRLEFVSRVMSPVIRAPALDKIIA